MTLKSQDFKDGITELSLLTKMTINGDGNSCAQEGQDAENIDNREYPSDHTLSPTSDSSTLVSSQNHDSDEEPLDPADLDYNDFDEFGFPKGVLSEWRR